MGTSHKDQLRISLCALRMTFVQAARLLCASRSNVPPQFREKRHKIGEHDVAEHIKEIALLLREERAFRVRVSVCVCVCVCVGYKLLYPFSIESTAGLCPSLVQGSE